MPNCGARGIAFFEVVNTAVVCVRIGYCVVVSVDSAVLGFCHLLVAEVLLLGLGFFQLRLRSLSPLWQFMVIMSGISSSDIQCVVFHPSQG